MENKQGTFSKLFGGFFFIINVLVVIWLGLCYAASVVSPASVKYLALFSLTTPFAILANALFIIFWIFSIRKLRCLLSLLALIACYNLVIAVFGLHLFSPSDMEKRVNTIKVMTWNVHGLGLYNKPADKNDTNTIAEIIKAENPDILCLPEYSLLRDSSTKNYAVRIARESDFKDYRFNLDNTYGLKVMLGTMVFSKYPIENYQAYDLQHLIFLVQCDIHITKQQVIRMFFTHLYSFGLNDHDREYIEEAKARTTGLENDLGHSRSFIWKFNRSWAIRAQEADSIATIIKQSPYPVLLCGDFNDLPASYTYTTIRGKLSDAFVEKGRGLGRTYNQIFPTLRIDHMLYSPDALHVLGYKSFYNPVSDHNPVIANFEIIGAPRN